MSKHVKFAITTNDNKTDNSKTDKTVGGKNSLIGLRLITNDSNFKAYMLYPNRRLKHVTKDRANLNRRLKSYGLHLSQCTSEQHEEFKSIIDKIKNIYQEAVLDVGFSNENFDLCCKALDVILKDFPNHKIEETFKQLFKDKFIDISVVKNRHKPYRAICRHNIQVNAEAFIEKLLTTQHVSIGVNTDDSNDSVEDVAKNVVDDSVEDAVSNDSVEEDSVEEDNVEEDSDIILCYPTLSLHDCRKIFIYLIIILILQLIFVYSTYKFLSTTK